MKSIDLHIHSNTDCNLYCKHCYNNSGEGKVERLPLDELKRYLKIFTSMFDCDIHLEGGEIFLYQEVFDCLYDLDNSILNKITITTNGTIFTQNSTIISVLRKIRALRISVEGHTQGIHQRLRNSSLDQVLSNGLEFQKLGINVILRITLHKYNQDSIFTEGIVWLYHKGFTKIQVYEFQEVGRGVQNSFTVTRDFNELFEQLESIKTPVDVKLMLSSRRLIDIKNYNWTCPNISIRINDDKESGLSIKSNGEAVLCAWNNDDIIANFSIMSDSQIYEFLSSGEFTHSCCHCSKAVIHKES